jgi:hypothetical protein
MRKNLLFLRSMLLLIVLFAAVFFFACTPKENDDLQTEIPGKTKIEQEEIKDPPKVDNKAPVSVAQWVYKETVLDEDGSILFDLQFSYPEILSSAEGSVDAVNEYYQNRFADYAASILADGYEKAKSDKEAAAAGDYLFMPHAYSSTPGIYYNGNGLLSVVNELYEYTGGAHQTTYWRSETFDLETGQKLALSDIFTGSKDEILESIYQLVLDQIEEQKGTDEFYYFDDYADNVRKYYEEEDFFLTADGIIFYYQPYAIAPHAAGLPMFKLPFDEAKTLALDLTALPAAETEAKRILYERAQQLIDRNITAFCEIFGLAMLELEMPQDSLTEESLLPVKDDRFLNYADLESFVRSTYIKTEADNLLANGRYHNVDGKLYADITTDAGMGYYIDWNSYGFAVSDLTESSAKLTIWVSEDSPAGEEELELTIKMIKENGTWLLEKMFY